MEEKLNMGKKERTRGKILAMVVERQITLKQAAKKMQVCYRQAKRIHKRYLEQGDKGLLHKSLGKPSPKRIDENIKKKCLELYAEKYPDFGPTLAAEKLEELDGIKINHETLRRLLIKEGLWSRKRRRNIHRSRRERRACFGQMLQFDGSHHKWFEQRGAKCCLMNIVDDATGMTQSFLTEQETTEAAMRLLWDWIDCHGIPQAVCCDKKNAYVITREPTISEIIKNVRPKTPFQKACEKLGIQIIVAHSAQSKGRVERNHGVYQDRFVKELRLAKINTIEKANAFLQKEYLPKINKKFAMAPLDSQDGHAPCPSKEQLADIFCYEEQRVVSNDFVIRYENRLFQITKSNRNIPRPKTNILVRELLDGTIKLIWNNKELDFLEITKEYLKEVNLS